jgi:acetate kinase
VTAPGEGAILVLNAGSSTLKASLLESGREEPLATTTVDWTGEPDEVAGPTLARVLDDLAVGERPLRGIGHRIVHGGPDLTEPRRLDAATRANLRSLVPLAPLHLPPSLAVIDAAMDRLGDVPHVGCFDTAFHATLPPVAVRYPVPDRWASEWGIRRFGFHGLSVEWAVGRAGALLGRPVAALRLVVAHLGAGSSVTAVDGGRSVDTSMGYTPLEGLMMATRSGSIDPGVLLALLRDRRLTADELSETLQHRSGLLAVGGSGDMRVLLDRQTAGDPAASLAIELYIDRAAAAIAASATRLPSLDALVVTGGIGEHADPVVEGIARRLGVLGIPPLSGARDGGGTDAGADIILTPPVPGPGVVRIRAREDLVIARAVERLSVG